MNRFFSLFIFISVLLFVIYAVYEGVGYLESSKLDKVNTYIKPNKVDTDKPEVDTDREKIVYGSLRFGDSKDVVEKKLESDPAVCRYSGNFVRLFGHPALGKHIDIGLYKYYIVPEFHKDKLYQIIICSYEETATYYSTKVKDYWRNLVDVISAQYGKEKWGRTRYIDFFEHKPGYMQFSHVWLYGTKTIQIGVGKTEYQYYAVLYISHQPTVDALKAVKKHKEREKRKKSSDTF